MDRTEFYFNFTKVLSWPLVYLFTIALFHGEISEFLHGDIEAEIFGVKLKGKRNSGFDELELKAKNLKETLTDVEFKLKEQNIYNEKLNEDNINLKKIIEDQNNKIEAVKKTDGLKTLDIAIIPKEYYKEDKLINRNISDSIQVDIDRAQSIVKGKDVSKARMNEYKGFELLLSNDFNGALQCFDNAYSAYPDYHNVDEIRKIIYKNLSELNNKSSMDIAKRKIFEIILTKYKWGMPEFVEVEMKKFLGGKNEK